MCHLLQNKNFPTVRTFCQTQPGHEKLILTLQESKWMIQRLKTFDLHLTGTICTDNRQTRWVTRNGRLYSQGKQELVKCKTVTWMQCKSLWIKASAKCINVNVNVNL